MVTKTPKELISNILESLLVDAVEALKGITKMVNMVKSSDYPDRYQSTIEPYQNRVDNLKNAMMALERL
jgi:phosphopantetheine adenylyltransferase